VLQVPLGRHRRDSGQAPVARATGLKVSDRQLGAAGIPAAGRAAEQDVHSTCGIVAATSTGDPGSQTCSRQAPINDLAIDHGDNLSFGKGDPWSFGERYAGDQGHFLARGGHGYACRIQVRRRLLTGAIEQVQAGWPFVPVVVNAPVCVRKQCVSVGVDEIGRAEGVKLLGKGRDSIQANRQSGQPLTGFFPQGMETFE
jgi:hypothetical protein